jgi:hypothetical protein
MPPRDHSNGALPRLLSGVIAFVCLASAFSLRGQGVPTVQQAQFRSQWVGVQVDQITTAGRISPYNELGSVVGSLQTTDQVERETEAALANPVKSSPFIYKPALGVGWQINNQGLQTTGANPSYKTGSSTFLAPSIAALYSRDHGPWTISSAYSAGYQYFVNQNFVGNGTGNERNPLNQTAMFNAALAMSRYTLESEISAASGNGYDVAAGVNNTQTTVNATVGSKYQLSSYSAVDLKAGYNIQNSSQSSNTPNNNITSFFANLIPVYELSDKTHLSMPSGIGQTGQSLQSGTQTPGSTNGLTSQQNSTRSFAQVLGEVKYNVTGKFMVSGSLGGKYVQSTGITNPIDTGLSPAWTVGLAYTPTPKVSTSLSAAVLGADVTPVINYILNWQPREKTSFSLTASQSQNFAQNVSSQYLVSQSIMGTITQKFFTDVNLNITGGYTHQTYKNLSSTANGQNTSQIPQTFTILQASLIWNIRDWVSLNNSVYYNGGQTQGGQGANGNNQQAQMWYSVSLNFAL